MLSEQTAILEPAVKAGRPIERFSRPFQDFAARETSGGILLLIATMAAIFWANSPWAESYFALWHTTLTLGAGTSTLSGDFHFWVNDGLMSVFFLVVGLEVKRELLTGELASPRRAALPIMAAIGGVLVPALIYSAVNRGGFGARGWGIPMATDIAFVMGALALLGSRVPMSLRVFLAALAIVDDIAAVFVIAIFYTEHIVWGALGLAAICFLALLTANRLAVRHPLPYFIVGFFLWAAVLQSGIHPTIAGVLLAMTIPRHAVLNMSQLISEGRNVFDHIDSIARNKHSVVHIGQQQAAIRALETSVEQAQSPLHRLEHGLHPWVAFFIMPVFAFANAGVPFDKGVFSGIAQPVPLGIILGLLLGKPIGITLASRIAVRTRLAVLPARVSWSHLNAAGWFGGIGFTMSIFVAGLAFSGEAMLNTAKIAIFIASAMAGLAGSATLLLRRRS
ncbi:MAG TPA: Na+/H+ antiporter NhaA [Bryobacteraceae bacterium]|jgi:NhaA family Na+:H+ antiporter